MKNVRWLQEGEQTRITPVVARHAAAKLELNEELAALKAPLPAVYRTCAYIDEVPLLDGYVKGKEWENERLRDSVFRKRTATEILKEGRFPTCSDTGVLFRALLIAQGVPAAHVEAFHEKYLLGKDFHGHVFGRVFASRGSFLVDPLKEPHVYESENEIFTYVIAAEGLDSWDIGIRGYDDLHTFRKENLPALMAKYKRLKAEP
ncbi:MAG: hypothetical protein QXD77_00130 [Candidatus Aenigmatarchaeota archaeon]